jgi:hypothetical protein
MLEVIAVTVVPTRATGNISDIASIIGRRAQGGLATPRFDPENLEGAESRPA